MSTRKKKANNCFRGTQTSARFHPGWMHTATLQSQGKGVFQWEHRWMLTVLTEEMGSMSELKGNERKQQRLYAILHVTLRERLASEDWIEKEQQCHENATARKEITPSLTRRQRISNLKPQTCPALVGTPWGPLLLFPRMGGRKFIPTCSPIPNEGSGHNPPSLNGTNSHSITLQLHLAPQCIPAVSVPSRDSVQNILVANPTQVFPQLRDSWMLHTDLGPILVLGC